MEPARQGQQAEEGSASSIDDEEGEGSSTESASSSGDSLEPAEQLLGPNNEVPDIDFDPYLDGLDDEDMEGVEFLDAEDLEDLDLPDDMDLEDPEGLLEELMGGGEVDPPWHANPGFHFEAAMQQFYLDHATASRRPPPVERYDSPAAWTAGPGGSGGLCHSSRVWTHMASISSHSQTADSMHLHTKPDGTLEISLVRIIEYDGHEEDNHDLLSVYRFVADGTDQRPEEVASAALPLIMGRVDSPYTMTRSGDGVTVALGMVMGLVYIYTFNEQREEGGQVLRLDQKMMQGTPMVNSLRFMALDDQEYLVVADQSGRVCMFTNPNTAENTRGKKAVPWREYTSPHFAYKDSDRLQPNWQHMTGVGWLRNPSQDDEYLGSANQELSMVPTIGFRRACNMAQPSPSGRFIAVLVDGEDGLVILRKDQGYRKDWSAEHAGEQPHLSIASEGDRPPWAAPLPQNQPGLVYGGQYCSWNADETLLAASSDSSHSVTVWSVPPATQPGVPQFQRVLRVAHTLREALALAFHPTDPGLLCFSERRDRVHLIDVAEEMKMGGPSGGTAKTLQTLTQVEVPWPPASQGDVDLLLCELGHLNGVAMTSDGSLFVAGSEGLLEVGLIKPWSHSEHKFYPAAFKAAAKAFLMCASRGDPSRTSPGLTLQDLPALAVAKIIAEVARFYKSYLPPCSTQISVERG